MKIEGKFIFKVAGTLTAISLVVALLLGLTNNKYIILLIMNVILLVSGTFMDVTPAILIFTPLFLPICQSFGMRP